METNPNNLIGIGEQFGTCGELVQGFLSNNEPFHVTCPINKITSVKAYLRKNTSTKIAPLKGFDKMRQLHY